MAQPFVVSLKLLGDGRDAVGAVSSTTKALDQLNAKTEAAKARAEALNTALGRRTGAEANRIGLQSTLESIQAEQRLEAAHLQTLVSEKARAESINRLAQFGRDAAQVNQAIAASEQKVSSAYDETAKAARAAAIAGRELMAAQANAMRARQDSINAALGIGTQSYGDRGADIAAYGQEMDRLRARFVPAVAAAQEYKRELDAINHAHRVGAINAEEQAAAVAALDARLRSASPGTQKAGGGAGSFHTTNLLFQAQDIAMMTAMGQAPMMLAMQQGMQVGGIFHQIGSGRQIVQALGGAIIGLLNPLNLATIAAIGLGAAGVQAFMGMQSHTKTASELLSEHRSELEKTVKGYNAAEQAIAGYTAGFDRMPRSMAEFQLNARFDQIREDMAAVTDGAAKMGGIFVGYGSQAEQSLSSLSRQFAQGEISAEDYWMGLQEVRRELNGLENALSGISVARLIDQMEQGALKAMALGDAMSTLIYQSHALASLSADSTLQGFFAANAPEKAIEALKGLTPELRTQKQIIEDTYRAALTNPVLAAGGGVELTAAYNAAIAAQDEIERRRAATAGGKSFDQWKSANDNFQQRIDQQRLEIELFGQSTYEVERQKAAFDLLNQARAAGVPIDQAINAQVQAMAHHYAAATAELERMREQQRLADEQMQFYRSTFVGLFSDMKSGLRENQTFWEAFGNAGANALDKIADRAMGMAANGLFDMIFGAVMGGIGGGATGGAWGNGLWGSAIFNAKGNVYPSPALADYRNTIVDQPTVFAFAKGAGIMGEAGAEAIIPLARTASGNLGVRAVSNGPAGAGVHFKLETHIDARGSSMSEAKLEEILNRRERQLMHKLDYVIPAALENGWRRGIIDF